MRFKGDSIEDLVKNIKTQHPDWTISNISDHLIKITDKNRKSEMFFIESGKSKFGFLRKHWCYISSWTRF